MKILIVSWYFPPANTIAAVRLRSMARAFLHDGHDVPRLRYAPRDEFIISHVGEHYAAPFQDLGVEYYRYVPGAC